MRYRNMLVIGLILLLFGLTLSSCKKKEAREQTATTEETKSSEEEVLYWTCGMHPSVKSDEPGKCPICNMDLVPVYKEGTGTEEDVLAIRLSSRAEKLAGVRTHEVIYLPLFKEIRAVGKIDYDERRIAYVASRIPGRIDKLFVDFTGVTVKKGDPLVLIYSPALVSTQEEYLLAVKALENAKGSNIPEVVESAKSLVESAKKRLLLWGITEEQIQELEAKGKVETHTTIYAPISGTVTDKTAVEGGYVKEGENIYTIAGLSHLWVLGDIYEEDISWVKINQEVVINSIAFPGAVFQGRISFINPYLDEKTRSIKIRVDIPNPHHKLKPGMYVDALINVPIKGKKGVYYTCPMHPGVISQKPGECPECGMYLEKVEAGFVLGVSKSAVLDVGTRKLVYVAKGKGIYEAREIIVGPEAEAMVDGRKQKFFPVLEGLAVGEEVVTRANFLIDSQTQLTGEAEGCYGGALETEHTGHQH